MEVHHHSHTARKKWTHYFWEFLMLFLAVSAGFLVENLREHYVENKREKVFIKSFIEDLKEDTAKITSNIELRNSKILMMDSLIKTLNSSDPNKDGPSVYYWGRRVTRSTLFQPNDRTIKQLKNAGGLRLIRNQTASNTIMTYDQANDYINYLQNNRETQELTEIYPLLAKLFDGNVLETMIHGLEITRPSGKPVLRSTDKNLILDLTYFLHQYKSTSIVIIARLQTLKKTAGEAIQFLQKEYQLE
ncbi:MAG TPA: hypothetical protein VFZ33_04045 [Chitinophagaceae bacterium]